MDLSQMVWLNEATPLKFTAAVKRTRLFAVTVAVPPWPGAVMVSEEKPAAPSVALASTSISTVPRYPTVAYAGRAVGPRGVTVTFTTALAQLGLGVIVSHTWYVKKSDP
jgi:hypothetical protein